MRRKAFVFFVISALAGLPAAGLAETPAERGLYLVTIAGCNDCHTPGGLLGSPDATRRLAGSDVGFAVPGVGVFVGGNLTPDEATGLGRWTAEEIVTAITSGKTPGGRMLSGVMPWPALSHLTHDDALAIAAYLKSLPAVKNAVPGPFGAGETPSVPVSTILPPSVYAGLPKPPAAK